MTTDDDKVSRRYRELARDEPPRHVDEAILAASRRAADARPAPLVAPAGRRRWYFPLAAAAVIVLAIAVTVHVERQQRNVEIAETPVPVPSAGREEKPAPEKREMAARTDAPQAPAPAAAAPSEARPTGARDSVRADAAGRSQPRTEAQSAMRQRSAELGALAHASPEQWLQGIADLRRQGRHEEADKALAEFRRAYPDYSLSDEIRAKVERR
jgi:hypothetical protein